MCLLLEEGRAGLRPVLLSGQSRLVTKIRLGSHKILFPKLRAELASFQELIQSDRRTREEENGGVKNIT